MQEDKVLEDYIPEKGKVETPDITKEVIVKFIPSMRQLFRVLRRKGHFIDSTDKKLKGIIRKAYQLRDDGFSEDERFVYFGIKSFHDRLTKLEQFGVGSQMYSKDDSFAVGTVIEVFHKEFDYLSFMVKFTNRQYPTLCNMDKHGKFTTSPDGTVKVLKRLS